MVFDDQDRGDWSEQGYFSCDVVLIYTSLCCRYQRYQTYSTSVWECLPCFPQLPGTQQQLRFTAVASAEGVVEAPQLISIRSRAYTAALDDPLRFHGTFTCLSSLSGDGGSAVRVTRASTSLHACVTGAGEKKRKIKLPMHYWIKYVEME